MKYAGKKAGLMPASKEVESVAEDKGENEATESKTTKKTGTFAGKSNKLGGGGRFAQLESKGLSGALAATIGRKKFGKAKFQSLAAKGKSGQ